MFDPFLVFSGDLRRISSMETSNTLRRAHRRSQRRDAVPVHPVGLWPNHCAIIITKVPESCLLKQSTQDTAVEEIAVLFLKSGYRLSSSNPCIRAEAWGVVVAVALPFFAAAGVLLRSPSPSIHHRPTGDLPLVVTAARAVSGIHPGHLRRQDEHRRMRKSLVHFSPFGCDVRLPAVRRRRRRQARRPVKLCCCCCFLLCRAYDRWSPLH
uniref:Uncharacterized protein n=1 Tax=Oryza barthii TaxID=65489 RepID=A0A0D3F4T2_9ORYZ